MSFRFYLGTHKTGWLARAGVPLFLSRRWLAERKRLPQAAASWVLDSGGYTELSQYGDWSIHPAQYIEEIHRYQEEVGRLDWVAPMDWMCEPGVRAKTGLTVEAHQRYTVGNFLLLRQILGGLVIPVLQGWELDDYLDCWSRYQAEGVELEDEPVVGIGSVCRRGADDEVIGILNALKPLRMHAFGVRSAALARSAHFLVSADSMAWSYSARRNGPLPGCPHASCQNCLRYALDWRSRQPAVSQLRLEIA